LAFESRWLAVEGPQFETQDDGRDVLFEGAIEGVG
jgi:hypothetical protein